MVGEFYKDGIDNKQLTKGMGSEATPPASSTTLLTKAFAFLWVQQVREQSVLQHTCTLLGGRHILDSIRSATDGDLSLTVHLRTVCRRASERQGEGERKRNKKL